MPLTWNEIKDRALAFSREWKGEGAERPEAQTFWNEFFNVFGVQRRRVAVFEKCVAKLPEHGKAKRGRIDAFWPGTLLVEQKSKGEDLDAAFTQATDYFLGLKQEEQPRYVVVSDFARLRLYDLDENQEHEFALKELHKKVHLFSFIAGYRKHVVREDDPINVRAVQQMGYLHDALKKDNYSGHPLEMFLVRLLFCLFADDTGIFAPKDTFHDLLETWTAEDGGDLGEVLDRLFHTLNTPVAERQKSLPEQFAAFPYVNGKLFEERLVPPTFNRAMRDMLLELCALDWGAISPAIFGAMFQKVIDLDEKDRRRQLGAHYTSEQNILKLIGPLFLDELRAEFERVKRNKNQLFEFQKKLARLTFLDPACGCGNFLVITYRELRRLELDLLKATEQFGRFDGYASQLLKVDVDQFYGIEIEEFPAQVAQVAMWLVDHQMNVEAGEYFGEPVFRIPLTKSATIRLGNALRIDWADFVPPTRLNYILGNPPFVGKKEQNAEQKEDLQFVTHGIKGAGVLDYVSGWYIKAAEYLTAEPDGFGGMVSRTSRDRKQHRDVRFGKGEKAVADLFVDLADVEMRARRAVKCAFVSTNSITQGEQVGVLWGWLLAQGIKIHFAHRTFQWMNDAPGKAAVHCVIIGFAAFDTDRKRLFEYADIKAEPHEVAIKNINPYLVDAPDVVLAKQGKPICRWAKPINYGSMALDDGHLLLTDEERRDFVKQNPDAKKYIWKFVGGEEFINRGSRWCLWLADLPSSDLARFPLVRERVQRVRAYRKSSGRATTVKLAEYPTLFGEDRQPRSDYLLIPKVSSENRPVMPIGICAKNVIASGSCLIVPEAGMFELGVLSSTMHMAWMRYTCGRLESRYQYSAGVVYNNFPWPTQPTDKQREAIEAAAQAVLDARDAEFKRDAATSLAVLYSPDTMPPALVKAHRELDRAVDAAYVSDGGKRTWTSDAERVAFLFTLHQKYTSLLPADSGKPTRAGQSTASRAASDPDA